MKNKTAEKKKFNFNFIDIILVLVILTAAGGLIYIFSSREIVTETPSEPVGIIYEINVSPMREEFKNLVNIGDTVIDSKEHYVIGEVMDVSYSTCYYVGVNKISNELVYSEYPGFVRMTITVKAEAYINNSSYSVGGYNIAVGSNVTFNVPFFTGSATCSSVTVLDS